MNNADLMFTEDPALVQSRVLTGAVLTPELIQEAYELIEKNYYSYSPNCWPCQDTGRTLAPAPDGICPHCHP